MLRLTATKTIDRPAAEVWRIVADYDRDPEWRKGVETMAPSTSGPATVGTTTAEVLRMGGRTYRNAGVVEAIEDGGRLAWRTVEGADARGSRTVTPIGDDRCQVSLELEVHPHGTERLLAPLLGRILQKTLTTDLTRLAALATAHART